MSGFKQGYDEGFAMGCSIERDEVRGILCDIIDKLVKINMDTLSQEDQDIITGIASDLEDI